VRVVIALGGNALCRRGEPLDAVTQRENAGRAAEAIAGIARKHPVLVTHGNGPQVGWLALQAEALGVGAPLDVLGAESEGLIGYWLEQELENRLPDRDVATLLTRVEVDADDPAFARPTKPVGPVYDEAQARRLAEERGWSLARERVGFRRVVPSPEPRRIREMRTIGLLFRLGVVVVCGGGGGIPVARSADGGLRGADAVVDKDLSAVLLATELGADRLILLTDVAAVYADWPHTREPVASASPRALRALELEPGSMGPKVEAASRFARQTGHAAAIGALEDAERVLAGRAGTRIEPGTGPLRLAGP